MKFIYLLPLLLIVIALPLILSQVEKKQDTRQRASNQAVMPTALNLQFSTYLGSSAEDSIRDVATDSQGNIYVTGGTTGTDFPTTPGAYSRTANGSYDVFVSKFDPNGNLVWSTLIGGPNYDMAYGIEVDTQGYVYVGGRAGAGFPTTSGVIQPNFAGDNTPNPLYGAQDGFAAKLSPDGSQLVWSTYFGSAGSDVASDIDIDSSGNVYLAMTETGFDLPHITPNAFKKVRQGNDAVLAKLSPDAKKALYVTYIGGSASDGEISTVRINRWNENIYFLTSTTSSDAYTSPNAFDKTYAGNTDQLLVTISPSGTSLLSSTYIGGNGYDGAQTHGMWVDPYGNAIVSFTTNSTNLPTSANAYQKTLGGNYNSYFAKISSDGSKLLTATYLGGPTDDGSEGVVIDSKGYIYAMGTSRGGSPITPDAFQKIHGGNKDAYLKVISYDMSQLIYATYLGGSGDDEGKTVAVDKQDNLILGGLAFSTNFPILNAFQNQNAGGSDGYFAKFSTFPTTLSPTTTTIPSTITPTKSPSSLPEDIDKDGCIGLLDFNAWFQAIKGTPRPNTFPDVNNDGIVDIVDFNLWFRAMKNGLNLC